MIKQLAVKPLFFTDAWSTRLISGLRDYETKELISWLDCLIKILLTSNVPVLAQRYPEKNEMSTLDPFYYFDIRLLQGLNKKEEGNWVTSSASIKAALGVLLEGASKLSAEELCLILRLPININEARKFMHKYQQKLQEVPEGITLKSGSSIWVKRGLGINNKFRTNAGNFLYAPVKVTDFNQPGAVSTEVNKWVKEMTNGYIPAIINPDSINSDAVMVLANAIYFKGDWKLEFDSKETHLDCFYTPECTKVKMMETAGKFKFGDIKNLNARVIELPYKNPRYSMVIIIPSEKTGLRRAAWDLPFNSFLGYLDDFPEMEIDLMMPLFSIDYSVQLKPILKDLEVSEIFSEDADFSELFHSGTSAKVSEIVHRARIEVGEKGTIAAGASAAQFLLLSTNNKPKFYVNRPFFFFVRDREAGFLFEGQVADAKSAQTQENHSQVGEVSGSLPPKVREQYNSPPSEVGKLLGSPSSKVRQVLGTSSTKVKEVPGPTLLKVREYLGTPPSKVRDVMDAKTSSATEGITRSPEEKLDTKKSGVITHSYPFSNRDFVS